MTVEPQETTTLHGGRLIARRLKAYGVSKLFTLSGGHIFPFYDAAVKRDVRGPLRPIATLPAATPTRIGMRPRSWRRAMTVADSAASIMPSTTLPSASAARNWNCAKRSLPMRPSAAASRPEKQT